MATDPVCGMTVDEKSAAGWVWRMPAFRLRRTTPDAAQWSLMERALPATVAMAPAASLVFRI